MPTNTQIIIKAISWRAVGILYTYSVSFVLTGYVALAAGIAGAEFFIKIILFYIHEKIWLKKCQPQKK